MKHDEAQALAAALSVVAESEPRFKGDPKRIYSLAKQVIDPTYLDRGWIADCHSFLSQFCTPEVELAQMEHGVACWVGADRQVRLVKLDLPTSGEEAMAFVDSLSVSGACRFCEILDDSTEMEVTNKQEWVHRQCKETWRRWKVAAEEARRSPKRRSKDATTQTQP